MSNQSRRRPAQSARPRETFDAPVQEKAPVQEPWTERLVLFLRVMAGVSLLKGLYHWAQVCSIGAPADQTFEMQSMAWQSATVFFAVIDLVAAVGLWLAAAWGAVVWLTSVVSMVVIEVFFPGVFGTNIFILAAEVGLLSFYLWLAIHAAREQPG